MIPIFPEKYYNSGKTACFRGYFGGKFHYNFHHHFFGGGNSFVLLFAVAVGPKSRIPTKFKLRVVGDVVNLLVHTRQGPGLKAGKVDRYFFSTKKKHPEKKHTGLLLVALFSHLEGLKIQHFFQES